MTAPHIVEISDSASGASARVFASFGFNCFDLKLPLGSKLIDILWSAPNFADGGQRPSHSGIPLLFPFPGRLGGKTLEWEGKTYELRCGDDGRGNAIHGYALSRPWRVIDQGENFVEGEFQASVDAADVLDAWPADYIVRARYEIAGSSLSGRYSVTNPDTRPLPWAFGTHPYFRLPLATESAADVLVRAPAGLHWPLENMLPTKPQTLRAGWPLPAGMSFSEMTFDDVFSGLTFQHGRCTVTVREPGVARLAMTFGEEFPVLVIYNPPHREAVCLEPYTALPDWVRLSAAGHDAGLRVLAPGASCEMDVVIELTKDDGI